MTRLSANEEPKLRGSLAPSPSACKGLSLAIGGMVSPPDGGRVATGAASPRTSRREEMTRLEAREQREMRCPSQGHRSMGQPAAVPRDPLRRSDPQVRPTRGIPPTEHMQRLYFRIEFDEEDVFPLASPQGRARAWQP